MIFIALLPTQFLNRLALIAYWQPDLGRAFITALHSLLGLIDLAEDGAPDHLDLGGGLGVSYESAAPVEDYVPRSQSTLKVATRTPV